MMSSRVSGPLPSRRRTAASWAGSAVAAPAIAGRARPPPPSSISGSAGCHTRRKPTIATTRQQRRDDVGELDRDVVRAHELADRERGAADHRRRPDGAHAAAAVDHADQDQRHEQRQQRRLAADHRAEVVLREFGQVARVTIGVAIAPNATGAVLATSATAAALIGCEADRDQHHRGDRHRRAEAGQRLQQRAEAERDDHGLDPLVVGDRRERPAQDREVPGLDGHVVDPDRVPDDPDDRKQAECSAFARDGERRAERHAPHEHGDQDRDTSAIAPAT